MILALYAFCALYLIPIYPHFASANEIGRWVDAAGLVEHGTLDTRWSQSLIGPLVDAARFQGHVYSNKAPGLALLGLPAYLLARTFLGPPTRSNIRWSWLLMRIVAVTVPAILLGLCVVRWPEPDPFALATLLLATPVFIYGSLLFSHVTAAALLYASFLCLFGFPLHPEAKPRDLLGGFLCGLGVITEYTLALPAIVLGIALLFSAGRFRRLARFVAGGAVWAAVLAIYDAKLFGSPFSLSAGHEASANTAGLASRGIFGVSWPTAHGIWAITGSFSRGLLAFSPVLILGIVALAPRAGLRSWTRMFLVLTFVLAIAGYPASHGGWGVGARYLVPIVPFFAEAMHERRVSPGALAAGLFTFSVVLCVLPIFTFPFAPLDFTFLHATFTRPLLSAGFWTPSWGSFAVGGWPALAPVALCLAAAVVAALSDGRGRALAGGLAGALLACGVVLAPIEDTANLANLRALLLDTHFRPAGRLLRRAAETSDPAESAYLQFLARASAATRYIPPDDWPYLSAPPDGETHATGGSPRREGRSRAADPR